eukprot:1098800-Pyramimonas_sp.AAC.1
MEQLEIIPLGTRMGMAGQAGQELRRAHRKDMQDSRKQHGQWPAQAEKKSGSPHKITKPPPRRETDTRTGTKTLCSPTDM